MIRSESRIGNLTRIVGTGILAFGVAGCNNSDRSDPDPERLPVAGISRVGTPTGQEIYHSILEDLNLNITQAPETTTQATTQNQEIPEIIFRAPRPGEIPNACLLPDGTHKIINIFGFNENDPISQGRCE